MIALASDCLLFRTANGESVPFSADMVSQEFLGESANLFDAEFVRHAASAVFHYFKHDLHQEIVSAGEFAGMLEKVLLGFAVSARAGVAAESVPPVREADLRQLASDSGKGFELMFFPLLRDEVRRHLQLAPKLLRFRGLRSCVKQLAGARRWCRRCQGLEEQIVLFLRKCLSDGARRVDVALIVE
jgi:hypothetical protein